MSENPEDIHCPVCGYYCLGKGGHGCIDKPYLTGHRGKIMNIERWTPEIKKEQCSDGLTLRMWTDKEGDYVLYSDYNATRKQLAEKDKEIAELRKKTAGSDYPVPAYAYQTCYAELEKWKSRYEIMAIKVDEKNAEIEQWKGSKDGIIIELEELAAAKLKAEAELAALKAMVFEAIDDEEELDGDMPDIIFDSIRNDKDAMTELLRITVRQTKANIKQTIQKGAV